MAKTAPVQDHKSALPSRRGRDTHPGPTVEVVRAYARVVTLAWWEGCLSGRGAPAMPVQAPPDAWPPAPLGAASTAEAKALGAFLAGLPAREAAARLGQFYSSLLPEAHRAENGIHYTPPALARLLLDRAAGAGHDWTRGMAVDPSCGAGALLVEAALRMATALDGSDAAWIVASVSQRLLGWDIDPFAAWLARVSVEIALLPHVLASGTRLGPVSACRDSLAGWDGHEGKHALVMGNPPFGRVKDTDELRGRFGRSLRGRPNLYTLFTDLAVHLAAPEGGIVAYLMPAGYLGGAVFHKAAGTPGRASASRKHRHRAFPCRGVRGGSPGSHPGGVPQGSPARHGAVRGNMGRTGQRSIPADRRPRVAGEIRAAVAVATHARRRVRGAQHAFDAVEAFGLGLRGRHRAARVEPEQGGVARRSARWMRACRLGGYSGSRRRIPARRKQPPRGKLL